MKRLPAEWHTQHAVLLTWPHKQTDWADNFEDVRSVYLDIGKAVLAHQNLIISCEDPQELEWAHEALRHSSKQHDQGLTCFVIPADDTWARDHGPITVIDHDELCLLDFTFNAWGEKFASNKDNEITRRLHALGAFGETRLSSIDFILEGGSIESDGEGTLLTTQACLLNDNRNDAHDRASIEQTLGTHLGCDRVLWLSRGHIIGDDTDSHIDTLARFCSPSCIAYVHCTDPNDPHFDELSAMENELKELRTRSGNAYQLIPLPLPKVFDQSGRRLGATYANFLIINQAVLLPVYGASEDAQAISILSQCFPSRQIIPIHCLPLIYQNGSLHCITMQLPRI